MRAKNMRAKTCAKPEPEPACEAGLFRCCGQSPTKKCDCCGLNLCATHQHPRCGNCGTILVDAGRCGELCTGCFEMTDDSTTTRPEHRIFVEWGDGTYVSSLDPDFQRVVSVTVDRLGPPALVEFRGDGEGWMRHGASDEWGIESD